MASPATGFRKAFSIAARAGGIAVLSVAFAAGALSYAKLHHAESLDPAGRAMTPGEIVMAQTVFADTVDYSRVRVHNAPLAGDVALTLGNDIYLEAPALHEKDLSGPDTGISVKQTLIHELTHVSQNQTQDLWTSLVQTWRTLPGRFRYLFFGDAGFYKYGVASNKPFAKENEEQQARMAENWFAAQEDLRSDVCTPAAGGNPGSGFCQNAARQRDALTTRIRPSLPLPGWKNQAP